MESLIAMVFKRVRLLITEEIGCKGVFAEIVEFSQPFSTQIPEEFGYNKLGMVIIKIFQLVSASRPYRQIFR
jgi:hypothetical protein